MSRQCPCCGGEMYTKCIVHVDLEANVAHIKGTKVGLAPRQAEVLYALAQSYPTPIKYDVLRAQVGGRTDPMTGDALMWVVSSLRGRLQPFGADIKNVRSFGYRLADTGVMAAAAE